MHKDTHGTKGTFIPNHTLKSKIISGFSGGSAMHRDATDKSGPKPDFSGETGPASGATGAAVREAVGLWGNKKVIEEKKA